MLQLGTEWNNLLRDEIEKSYFKQLMQDVKKEYEQYTCYPAQDLMFSALTHCDFDAVKVVIIGQDPYHGKDEANGLCFSVNQGVKIPPSLRNIFREISTDLNTVFIPIDGDLKKWAEQGVLLLNNSLTVRANEANSHKHLKWSIFTDAIIQKISDEKEAIVFLLWGSFAQKKGSKIDRNKHLVLQAGHPSPLSANQGKWFGHKHFSQTNDYLKSKNKNIIVWNTD